MVWRGRLGHQVARRPVVLAAVHQYMCQLVGDHQPRVARAARQSIRYRGVPVGCGCCRGRWPRRRRPAPGGCRRRSTALVSAAPARGPVRAIAGCRSRECFGGTATRSNSAWAMRMRHCAKNVCAVRNAATSVASSQWPMLATDNVNSCAGLMPVARDKSLITWRLSMLIDQWRSSPGRRRKRRKPAS